MKPIYWALIVAAALAVLLPLKLYLYKKMASKPRKTVDE